jgi:hypothetical protein
VGFVGEEVALGHVFSKYFGFPCQFAFHRLLHKSSSSVIWSWYNRPVVAAIPSGLSLTTWERRNNRLEFPKLAVHGLRQKLKWSSSIFKFKIALNGCEMIFSVQMKK